MKEPHLVEYTEIPSFRTGLVTNDVAISAAIGDCPSGYAYLIHLLKENNA